MLKWKRFLYFFNNRPNDYIIVFFSLNKKQIAYCKITNFGL